MELLPGCLFIFPLFAALLPLAARAGPTPLTAGQKELGTSECVQAMCRGCS